MIMSFRFRWGDTDKGMDAKERIIEQRMARRRRTQLILKTIIALLILVAVLLITILVRAGMRDGFFEEQWQQLVQSVTGGSGSDGAEGVSEAVTVQADTGVTRQERQEAVLAQAELMAAQYDYEGAIRLLQMDEDYDLSTALQNAVAAYRSARETLVSYPVSEVTHIFFHILIYDTDLAFDGDLDAAGYNQVMATVSEFNSILEQMYERGYVMVGLHDLCETDEDGQVSQGEIRLPEGKIPFVLSQDDVCYYHYMDGDGFASRLVVDEDGRVRCLYEEEDGTQTIGDYDLVPIIDTFVEQHPDFAYHGHKGVIALTGYEGVLGYRTDEVYRTRDEDRLTSFQKAYLEEHPDFDFEEQVREATEVAEAMKASGWEFASHTWGHIAPLEKGYERTVTDTQRWQDNVAPIVGDTDILIFAFGADINDWTAYTSDNEYFRMYKEAGFNIFCNVDGSQTHWIQFGDDYMRMSRRNVDGYRMYYNPDLLGDLFDVAEAWDDARPTPVTPMASELETQADTQADTQAEGDNADA